MVLKSVDAVVVRASDLDAGLRFYCDRLGLDLVWRSDSACGLSMNGGTELVLSTEHAPETDLLVDSVGDVVDLLVSGGGAVVAGPLDIPVGRLAVVDDPFGNRLTLVDLSKGTYATDEAGNVTGVASP